ncbi:MAG TPA: glycosyltransferase [bacterium]|nr:glycosyltransferase [bacterium]
MTEFFNIFILYYFIVLNTAYTGMMIISLVGVIGYVRRLRLVNFKDYFKYKIIPPVSVIAPAYNEELTVAESVKSLLMLQYPEYELIIVNDGSKDRTLEVLIENFDLHISNKAVKLQIAHKPIKNLYRSKMYNNLIVIDKENGRKADALNAGINCSKYNHFCSIDADSILEKDSILRSMRPFIENPDRMMAVGGIVRIANGCDIKAGEVTNIRLPNSALPMFQVIEYFRAFLAGRIAFDVLNCLLIISGAFGVFRKDIVLKCGGYAHNTVGEDMELVVKIHKYCLENKIPYKIAFTPDPVCWTEAPDTTTILGRQRGRWQRGTMETLFKYKNMIFNPKYKIVGMFGFPFFLFFEMMGPVVELTGYIYAVVGLITGHININFAIMFFIVAYGWGVILSILSVFIEELSFKKYPKLGDILKIVYYSFLENLGYRQLTLVWRLQGIVDYFSNVQSWGEMTRSGFNKK